MIIDKEYDDSLWCMFISDKNNREEIIGFIKQLPKEVLEKARTLIKAMENDEYEYLEESYFVEDKADPTIEYYVSIEVDDGCLTIEKSRLIPIVDEDGTTYNDDEQLFELMVLPMNEEKIDDLEYLDEDDSVGWLGSVVTEEDKQCDYDLRMKRNKLYVRRSKLYLDERIGVPSYVKLDLNEIPEDLNIDDVPLLLKKRD